MRIRPADLLLHLDGSELHNRVDIAKEIHDKIYHWVKKMILDFDEVKSRGKALNLFADAVEVCLVMTNLLGS
jgi:hypothetical protein